MYKNNLPDVKNIKVTKFMRNRLERQLMNLSINYFVIPKYLDL